RRLLWRPRALRATKSGTIGVVCGTSLFPILGNSLLQVLADKDSRARAAAVAALIMVGNAFSPSRRAWPGSAPEPPPRQYPRAGCAGPGSSEGRAEAKGSPCARHR